MENNKQLTTEETATLISILKSRFEKNTKRHSDLDWNKIQEKLEKTTTEKLWSLNQMEQTGGEPDVVNYEPKTDEYTFFDCAAESPKERRSFCYDQQALEARKANKPKNTAIGLATKMGIELLTEEEYRALQKLGDFDTKTSSWLKTPEKIRKLGGAIFGDFRFDTVFVYHNGAESYYGGRGFRGSLKI